MNEWYYVLRNNNSYGPYSLPQLDDMVFRGRVLTCDKAVPEGKVYDGQLTVGKVLKRNGYKRSPRMTRSWIEQLRDIGNDIIFPGADLKQGSWKQDTTLLLLAAVGIMPALIEIFGGSSYLTFYVVSLYFSSIWGLFFFYVFRTKQVKLSTTIKTFFLTQVLVFVAWDVLALVDLNPFYGFANSSSFIGQALFYIAGVGVTEEFFKALPLFFILWRAKEPLVPQTMVYYGLMSGISFGVFEGVNYQMNVNSEYGYSMSFLLNICRLTYLPFAHAIWAGIAGYFLSFAVLFPANRIALRILAILVPAVLHGCYDLACSAPGLISLVVRVGILFFAAVLLRTYLRRDSFVQSRLASLR